MPMQKKVVSVSTLLASLIVATSALAQDNFTVHNVGYLSGQGQLESNDQRLDDGRLVDTWPVYVEAGERISIILESASFEPLLWVEWTDDYGRIHHITQNIRDPKHPERTQLDITVEDDIEVRVAVTSQAGVAVQGAYSIALIHSELPTFAQPAANRLEASGVITTEDYTSNDGTPFDPLVFDSTRGTELEITVNSIDFDPVLLLLYQGENGEIELLGTNDDVDSSTTNSAMHVTIPKDGTFIVVVRPFDNSARGRYDVSVRDINYVSTGQDRISEAAAFSDFIFWNNWASLNELNSTFYGF